jgi:hypothetical protein
MNGSDNHLYLLLLLLANLIAIVQLSLALKWPRICRISFFLLFAWASWKNWTTVNSNEREYLIYADLTWSHTYANFIHGWFALHITPFVKTIAVCQALIAVSMSLPGRFFKLGAIGAIVFLLAILPLGVGAGFPSTFIMSLALLTLLLRTDLDRAIFKLHSQKGVKQTQHAN